MKKILLPALFAAVAASANAQYYVGGSVGFETSKTKGLPSSTTFTLLPDFGYEMDEQLGFGIEIGYQHTGNYANELVGSVSGLKANTFKIAPYVRYTYLKTGMIKLFLDGKVGFSTTSMKRDVTSIDSNGNPISTTQKYNDRANAFSITVEPGIAFEVAKSWSIEAKTTNLLGFHHTWYGNMKSNAFGLGVNTLGLNFGAYYHF